MNYLNLLPLTSFFFCIGITFLVAIRSRWNLGSLSFIFAMASLACVEFANYMTLLVQLPDQVLLWKKISLIGEMILSGNWLLFSLTFGKVNYKSALKRWRWILTSSYLVLGSFAVLLSVTPQALTLKHNQLIMLAIPVRYFSIPLLLLIIISLKILENTFRSSTGVERWRIKYFFFGIGAILVIFVYCLCQRILYFAVDLHNIYSTSSVIIIANILISYSIIKSKVIDGDLYVSRRVIYSSISLCAIGIYSIIVALGTRFIKTFNVNRYIDLDLLLVFLAVLLMFIFFYKESFRRKIKAVINKNFKKSKYVFQDEWLVFSSELSQSSSCNNLCENFLKILSERIFVRTVSLWLFNENKSVLYLISSRNLNLMLSKLSVNENICTLYAENKPIKKHILMNDEKFLSIRKELSILLENTRAELLVPLMFGNTWIGVLTLGGIQTGEPYDENEDYNLLQSVAAHASSAIHNARIFEEQMRVRELETFNRLSSFVIHDLKNTTSMLSMVVQNAQRNLCNQEFQKDALETISVAVSKMKSMIGNLSALPAELKLRRQLVDFNLLIREAVHRLVLPDTEKIKIERQLGRIPPVNIDLEEMHKVMHNLLVNACEALNGAGIITISTVLEGENVVVSVSDTGPGMSREFIDNGLFQPFKSTKKNGLGIGLYQCKTIVEAHEGAVEVESLLGKGSTFSIYIPVPAECSTSN